MATRLLYRGSFARGSFALGVAIFATAFALGIVQAWQSNGQLPPLPYDELGQARDASEVGDVAVAERELRTYASLRPGSAPAWMRLAQFLQSIDDRRGAIPAYERAVACIPAPALAYRQLAILYREEGNLELARARGVVAEKNGAPLPPEIRAELGL